MSINWLNVAEKLHKKPTDSSILLTLLLQLLQLLFSVTLGTVMVFMPFLVGF